jgi:hypothetical protein
MTLVRQIVSLELQSGPVGDWHGAVRVHHRTCDRVRISGRVSEGGTSAIKEQGLFYTVFSAWKSHMGTWQTYNIYSISFQ